MKKMKMLMVAITLCSMFFAGGMAFLAEVYPFHPGDILYGFQNAAEQTRLHLTYGAANRAQYTLILLERRLADLGLAEGSRQVRLSVAEVDVVLNQAIQLVDKAPSSARDLFYQRLALLLEQGEIILASLDGFDGVIQIAELSQKVSVLLNKPDDQKIEYTSQDVETQALRISVTIISFLGKKVEHNNLSLKRRSCGSGMHRLPFKWHVRFHPKPMQSMPPCAQSRFVLNSPGS